MTHFTRLPEFGFDSLVAAGSCSHCLRMWQRMQRFCLILATVIAGSLPFSWDMKVFPVVSVPRGEDTVLMCSFTHPGQQTYSGSITVKWLARQPKAQPFFSCSVRNDSSEEPSYCLASRLRYSLRADPRCGELSLVIRKVHLGDNGTYFCRVELDGWHHNIQKETHLYVTVKPQILSLSEVETNSGSDGATRNLQCEVEGHPLPTITWLSESRSLTGDQVQTSPMGPHGLVSTVPYLEGEVLTCRAESRLGGAERRYPQSNILLLTVTACGLIVLLLLLLLLTGLILWRRSRARTEASAVIGNTETAPDNDSPVYENTKDVENLQDATELHVFYSTVTVTREHAGVSPDGTTDVLYSPVNVP